MCSNDLSQVCQTPEMTVLAAYEPLAQSGGYQSEAQMEAGLISALQAQGYEYLDIKDEAGLLGNLRACIEVLNNISFSDAEWRRWLSSRLLNKTCKW